MGHLNKYTNFRVWLHSLTDDLGIVRRCCVFAAVCKYTGDSYCVYCLINLKLWKLSKLIMQDFVVRSVCFGGAFAMLSLGLLYTFQDKMLYLPGSPIRHIRDNPRGYRSPDERSITYSNIRLSIPEAP